jgi:hypothetical protein
MLACPVTESQSLRSVPNLQFPRPIRLVPGRLCGTVDGRPITGPGQFHLHGQHVDSDGTGTEYCQNRIHESTVAIEQHGIILARRSHIFRAGSSVHGTGAWIV